MQNGVSSDVYEREIQEKKKVNNERGRGGKEGKGR